MNKFVEIVVGAAIGLSMFHVVRRAQIALANASKRRMGFIK